MREAAETPNGGALSEALLGKQDDSHARRDLSRLDAAAVACLCSRGQEHEAAELYLKRLCGKPKPLPFRADFAQALDRAAWYFYMNAPSFSAFVDNHPKFRRISVSLEEPSSVEILRDAFLLWSNPAHSNDLAKMADAILGEASS